MQMPELPLLLQLPSREKKNTSITKQKAAAVGMYEYKLPFIPPKGHVNPYFQAWPGHHPRVPPFTFCSPPKDSLKKKISFPFPFLADTFINTVNT